MVANVNEGCLVTVFKGKDDTVAVVYRKGEEFPHGSLESVRFQSWMAGVISKNLFLLCGLFLNISWEVLKIPFELRGVMDIFNFHCPKDFPEILAF